MNPLQVAAFSFVLAISAPAAALADPGALDAEGCRKQGEGSDKHCHAASAAQDAAPPARSTPPGGPSTQASAYRNCTEARAAGAAPVRRGEPGYGVHLDRDNDGIGCE